MFRWSQCNLLSWVAFIALAAMAGCGGSGADLDEAYGLNDPDYKRNAGSQMVALAAELKQGVRSRESSPQMAISMAAENFASIPADHFADYAEGYEQLKATMSNLSERAKSGASRSQLGELSQAFEDQAKQLEEKMAPAE